jgi:hypothetical protein
LCARPHDNEIKGLRDTTMLAKCANSSCSASFLFLHSGKLFHFDKLPQPGVDDTIDPVPGNPGELFWLCDKCSAEFTLASDGQHGVRAVLKPHAA